MRLVIAFLIPLAAHAQMRDNRDKELNCQDRGYTRQVRRCDLREQTFTTAGNITVDPGGNGGVSVKGWLRKDVLVRSRVEAWADTDTEASSLMTEIHVDIAGSSVTAHGPSTHYDRRGWAVSYEIFVPRSSNLSVKAANGGIDASDVQGTVQLETLNGGIHVARFAGDVRRSTTNGGLNVELIGNTWSGRQLELSTTNGSVTVSMPEGYSAHVQAETVNGGVHSDFPVTVTGRIRPRNLDAKLGSGGPLIHIRTVNGGVNLRRA